MPIANGNPLNGNPAVEEGNHEPARNLRQTIYDSVKFNLDQSTNSLQQSIRLWDTDESNTVEKILLALEVATEEVDAMGTKIKLADEATREAFDLVMRRVWGDERAELSTALQAQRCLNVDIITFLNQLKYTTLLGIEHDINVHHSNANTKRVEFKAHIDAVNDVTEIMSGELVEMATQESWSRRKAAALRATIENCTRSFIGSVFILNFALLLLLYYHIIPPFIVIYIARFVIWVVGGEV